MKLILLSLLFLVNLIGVSSAQKVDPTSCFILSATITCGNSSITPVTGAGGSNTQLQYNNAGSLGGISGWTTNGSTTITGNTLSLSNYLTVQNGHIAQPNDSVYIGPGAAQNKLTNSTSANDVIIGRNAGFSLPADTLSFHTFVGMDAGGNVTAGAGGTVG